MLRTSSEHQVTLPVQTLEHAGLAAGDGVAIEVDGPDQIVIRRASPDPGHALGIFDGLYPAGYLQRLRSGERA